MKSLNYRLNNIIYDTKKNTYDGAILNAIPLHVVYIA